MSKKERMIREIDVFLEGNMSWERAHQLIRAVVQSEEWIDYLLEYIKGELNSEEEDALWVEFLEDQELYRYFDTYLLLVSLTKTDNIQSIFNDKF